MTEPSTAERLERAIRDHVSEEGEGAYLTDWIVIAAAAMPDDPDATTYITESSDGPIHHRLGLVRYLSLRGEGLVMGDEDES